MQVHYLLEDLEPDVFSPVRRNRAEQQSLDLKVAENHVPV